MSKIFPEPILRLPLADIPLKGAKAYISQSGDHQVLFMEFEEDVDVPEHSHDNQWAVVLDGRIDLTVAGIEHTYGKGDRYFIPVGIKHLARIYAGYADITFFADSHRYKPKRS